MRHLKASLQASRFASVSVRAARRAGDADRQVVMLTAAMLLTEQGRSRPAELALERSSNVVSMFERGDPFIAFHAAMDAPLMISSFSVGNAALEVRTDTGMWSERLTPKRVRQVSFKTTWVEASLVGVWPLGRTRAMRVIQTEHCSLPTMSERAISVNRGPLERRDVSLLTVSRR